MGNLLKGPFNARVMSFTLNRAWIYVSFFSVILVSPFASDAGATLDRIYLISMVTLVVMLAVFAFYHAAIGQLLESRRGRLLGPAMAALGTALVPLVSLDTTAGVVSLVISSLLTGTGSALLLLDIGRSYARVGGRRAAIDVSLGFLLSAFLYPLLFFVPYGVAVAVTVLLPLGSIFFLLREHVDEDEVAARVPARASDAATDADAANTPGPNATTDAAPQTPTPVIKPILLIKFAVSAIIFGMAAGFMRDLYTNSGFGTLDATYSLYLLVATIIAASLIGLGAVTQKSFRLEFFYRPVLLLLAAGYLLLSFIHQSIVIPFVIVCIGYTLFELLTWVVLSEIAGRFQYSPIQVVGLGRAIATGVGIFPGVFISRSFFNDALTNDTMLSIIAIFAVIALIVAYIFVLTEKDVQSLAEKTPEENTSPYSMSGAAFEGYPNARPTGTDNPDDILPHGAEAQLTLEDRCRAIGAQRGLSKRETEVFYLLATGRNKARICEELVISQGTANTHLRHIYQKLGTHTQQELIDLVHEADPQDSE